MFEKFPLKGLTIDLITFLFIFTLKQSLFSVTSFLMILFTTITTVIFLRSVESKPKFFPIGYGQESMNKLVYQSGIQPLSF